jgi:hypothetical protein
MVFILDLVFIICLPPSCWVMTSGVVGWNSQSGSRSSSVPFSIPEYFQQELHHPKIQQVPGRQPMTKWCLRPPSCPKGEGLQCLVLPCTGFAKKEPEKKLLGQLLGLGSHVCAYLIIQWLQWQHLGCTGHGPAGPRHFSSYLWTISYILPRHYKRRGMYHVSSSRTPKTHPAAERPLTFFHLATTDHNITKSAIPIVPPIARCTELRSNNHANIPQRGMNRL